MLGAIAGLLYPLRHTQRSKRTDTPSLGATRPASAQVPQWRRRVQAVWKRYEISVVVDSSGAEAALESRSLGLRGLAMHRFIGGEDRMQRTLLPNSLEDYVSEENPVRVIEVFIEELDLATMGFAGMTPAATGRPAYHPSTLLKIYLYGYLNQVQSSRRL